MGTTEQPDAGDGVIEDRRSGDDRRKVFSLCERRPQPEPEWTPEEALQDFLDEVKAGKIKPAMLAIYWYEKTEDGLSVSYWRQGMDLLQLVALTAIAQRRAIAEATGE